jgi:hypothetical protein
VQASLGLQVIDEVILALVEKQPGFAKVFFYLEQEVMKPRYEIHSLSMIDAVEEQVAAQNGPNQLAVQALFSATQIAHPAKLDVAFGRNLPQKASKVRVTHGPAVHLYG